MSMVDYILEVLKGVLPPVGLDKTVEITTGVTGINQGTVCSLDATGKLQKGLSSGAVALFARQNQTDPDVAGSDENIAGGRISALVCLGGYELESTEFVASETYAPGDPLTAGEPGAADAGLLKPGTVYTDTICGIVSDGVVTNAHGKSVLRFWTCWLPPLPASQ